MAAVTSMGLSQNAAGSMPKAGRTLSWSGVEGMKAVSYFCAPHRRWLETQSQLLSRQWKCLVAVVQLVGGTGSQAWKGDVGRPLYR